MSTVVRDTTTTIMPSFGTHVTFNLSDDDQKIVEEPCKPLEEEKLYTGKVLQLTKFHFEDPDGRKRSVEGVQRSKKNGSKGGLISAAAGRGCGIATIAVLRRQIMCDCMVLVKQYRGPLKGYTLEFPASIQSRNENPEESACKEIEDDTGYTSTDIKYISPVTSIDPDISDGRIRLVSLNIDGDDPLQHPSPRNPSSEMDNGGGHGKGGHGDIIEVIHVPVNGLLERLHEYSEQGIIIDSRVYAFAIGLKKGEKMALAQVIPECSG